jgi:hypothetical protein
VSLPTVDLINPENLLARYADTPQILTPLVLLQLLDCMPLKQQLFRDFLH